MKSRRQRASFVSRAILKVGILWFAASAGASGTATSHPVEGDALYRLRDLIAAKNAGALYDFLNRSWLRGDIDATPDIEALALAIEAKDFTTYHHLRRVGIYAVESAKEMGLPEPELQALQAASLLHK